MCYHKSLTKTIDYLADYYSSSYGEVMKEVYTKRYHENGFDYHVSPIITASKPNELQPFKWGFVPWWAKTEADGLRMRTQTLNCISEEMYDKPSFKDAAKNNQRCLIPCTGFYEWRWMDEKGKSKVPYHITLKDQELFSIAGLYSRWKNKDTEQYYFSYTVLTTTANPLMSKIHNSKKRMPVLLPREFEKDWLNPNLTKEDVLALCQPLDDGRMSAYTISKRITTKGIDTNIPEVSAPQSYTEVTD